MSVPAMLRVKPHPSLRDIPVPLEDGTKLRAADCPPEGKLVRDTIYVRRRVMFNELVIVAEGDAALPKADAPKPPAKKE